MWQISNWTLCSLSACTTTILLDTVHPTVHVHMYVVRYTLCVLCICYTLYTIRYTLYAIKKTWQPLEAGSYKKVSTAANQAKGWLVTSLPAAEPENPAEDKNNFSWIQQIPTEPCQSCLTGGGGGEETWWIYWEEAFLSRNQQEKKMMETFYTEIGFYKKRFDKKSGFDFLGLIWHNQMHGMWALDTKKLILVFTRTSHILTCSKGYPVSEKSHHVTVWVSWCAISIQPASDWLSQRQKGQCTTWHSVGGGLRVLSSVHIDKLVGWWVEQSLAATTSRSSSRGHDTLSH